MGTITIQAAGFANTPISAPSNWPSGITWPSNSVSNGSKTYTITDADWISLITWVAANSVTQNLVAPPTPTAQQLLLNWVQSWITGTQRAVQQYFTVTPPQIGIN